MDEKRLAEIKGRLTASPPLPWIIEEIPADAAGYGPWFRILTGSESVLDRTTCERMYRHEAEFIAHARTDVPDLVAEVEKQRECVAELEAIAHDAAEGVVPAALLAEARRQEREALLAAAVKDTRLSPFDISVFRMQLPPLPAESPTARELRERAAVLEKDNARLREALEAIYQPTTRTLLDARNTARAALEATE